MPCKVPRNCLYTRNSRLLSAFAISTHQLAWRWPHLEVASLGELIATACPCTTGYRCTLRDL